MKIGRNEPCRCGSGAKYKRCCLAKDEAAAREPRASAPGAETDMCLCADCEQDVYDLSAEAMDLIDARRFDEAEPICHQLRKEFPELVEGHEYLAAVGDKENKRALVPEEALRELPRPCFPGPAGV